MERLVSRRGACRGGSRDNGDRVIGDGEKQTFKEEMASLWVRFDEKAKENIAELVNGAITIGLTLVSKAFTKIGGGDHLVGDTVGESDEVGEIHGSIKILKDGYVCFAGEVFKLEF